MKRPDAKLAGPAGAGRVGAGIPEWLRAGRSLARVALPLHNSAHMRRAALVALLALPSLAVAAPLVPTPTAGQITYPTVALSSTDGYINLDECLNARTITLKWAISYATGASFANVTSYQLYAGNSFAPTTGDCQQATSTTGVVNGPASDLITTNLADPSVNTDFDTSLIATVSGYGSCAGSDAQIDLCIQARNGTTNIGTARTTLTFSVSAPGAPTGVSASPGDSAANVSWSAPSGSPTAMSYEVDATGLGTIDPSTHASPRVTGTGYRLGGLVNGETYSIQVRGFSIASNPGAFSTDVVQVTPQQVNDFWQTYQADGGRDSGGCGGGPAGPLALALLAGAFALSRRAR